MPLGAFAFLPDLASFPLPAPLAWQGRYADFAPAAPDPNAWTGTLFAFVPDLPSFAVPSLAWIPSYPDFARGPAPLPVSVPFYAANVEPITAAPLLPLSWAPSYPMLLGAVADPNAYRTMMTLPAPGRRGSPMLYPW